MAWPITIEVLRTIPGFSGYPTSRLNYAVWLLTECVGSGRSRAQAALKALGLPSFSHNDRTVLSGPRLGDVVIPIAQVDGRTIMASADTWYGFGIVLHGRVPTDTIDLDIWRSGERGTPISTTMTQTEARPSETRSRTRRTREEVVQAARRQIVEARVRSEAAHWGICSNCEQWQSGPRGDCFNECAGRGFARFAQPPPETTDVIPLPTHQGTVAPGASWPTAEEIREEIIDEAIAEIAEVDEYATIPPRLGPINTQLVLRIEGDNLDVHAVPIGPGITHRDAIRSALDLALPDEGARVEWAIIEADDPAQARMIAMNRGRVQLDAIDWRPVAGIILNAWHRQREYAQDRAEQAEADQAEAANDQDALIYVIEGIGPNYNQYWSNRTAWGDLAHGTRFTDEETALFQLPANSQWVELHEAVAAWVERNPRTDAPLEPWLVLKYIEYMPDGSVRETSQFAEALAISASPETEEQAIFHLLEYLSPTDQDGTAMILHVPAPTRFTAMQLADLTPDDDWTVVPDRIVDQYFRNIQSATTAQPRLEQQYSRIYPPQYTTWFGEEVEVLTIARAGQDAHRVGQLPFAVYRRPNAEMLNEIRPWLDDVYRSATHSLEIIWEDELHATVIDRFQHGRPIYSIIANPIFQPHYHTSIEAALRTHGPLDDRGNSRPLEINRLAHLNANGELEPTGQWTDYIHTMDGEFFGEPAWAPYFQDRIGYEGYDYHIDVSPSVKTYGIILNNEERELFNTPTRSMIETTLAIGEEISVDDTALAVEMTEYFPTMETPEHRHATFVLKYVNPLRAGQPREWLVTTDDNQALGTLTISDNISEPRLIDLLERAELLPHDNTYAAYDSDHSRTFHRQLVVYGRGEDGTITAYTIEDVAHNYEGDLVESNIVRRLTTVDFVEVDVARVEFYDEIRASRRPGDEGTVQNPIYEVHTVGAEENDVNTMSFRDLPEGLRILISYDPTQGHYVWRSQGGSEDTVRYTATQIEPPLG